MGQMICVTSSLPDSAPIINGHLDEDLRCFLLAAVPETEEGLLDVGCERCVDHPECSGHQYIEGYFHSYNTTSNVPSVHPRLGSELSRPAAPAALRAFCECIRRKNSKAWCTLEAELRKSTTAAPLAAVLERKSMFADLALQVHWGEEIAQRHVAWHIDAPNSFIHMAVGLQGERTLHARRRVVKGRVSHNCAIGPSDDRDILPQAEGSIYVCSPCCFPHAVQYPAVDWSRRIVALQCRLHLTEDEIFGDIDPKGGAASILFRHLTSIAPLLMPTLSDVQELLDKQ